MLGRMRAVLDLLRDQPGRLAEHRDVPQESLTPDPVAVEIPDRCLDHQLPCLLGGVDHLADQDEITPHRAVSRRAEFAMQSAVDLIDAIDQHGENWSDLVLALDQHAGEHLEPFYTDQATTDAARLAVLRHTILGAPAPLAPDRRDRVNRAHGVTAWSPSEPTQAQREAHQGLQELGKDLHPSTC